MITGLRISTVAFGNQARNEKTCPNAKSARRGGGIPTQEVAVGILSLHKGGIPILRLYNHKISAFVGVLHDIFHGCMLSRED
jgi:hypothetical protein